MRRDTLTEHSFAACSAWGTVPPPMTTNRALDRICGHLVLGGYVGEAPPTGFTARLRNGRVAGAILFRRNLPSIEAGYDAAHELATATQSECPPFIAVDQEGGRVRRFTAPMLQLPSMRCLAAADNGLVERAAAMLGRQLGATGFNLDFAPVLDVDTNPNNPIIGDHAFSGDPAVVANLGKAFLFGLQSVGVAACGKHFPGHGDTSVDSHLHLPYVRTTLAQLRAVEFVPFAAAIGARVDALMTAHIVCEDLEQGVPATLSRRIVTGLLREELGFEGVVFSDDLEMKAIEGRWSVARAAVEAVRAGCDVVCICKSEAWQEEAHEALVRECERTPAFLDRCEHAAERSIELRRRRPPNPAKTFTDVLRLCESAEGLAISNEIEYAIRGIV